MKTKENKRRNMQYIPFKRKIFFKILSSALIMGVISIIFYNALRGNTADTIIEIIDRAFVLTDKVDSEDLYQTLIRNNMNEIINVYLVLSFILVLGIVYWRVTNYVSELFGEVNEGLEKIKSNEKHPIALREELGFMESSINESKDIIQKREEEARIADQRKNDLVVYLAHDIKTPLTSVIGYLSLMEEALELPAEIRAKYLNITLEKALSLEQLINEFFEITRYNLQAVELDYETIDLYYMLFQMIDEFYPILLSEEKQIELHADESLTLDGDSYKLARVFNNVMKNAITYSDSGTSIHVFAEKIENQVVIRFQNMGKTIPKQKLDSIFEKFLRLDEARSTSTGGAGLGLAIAKEIVELHGGTITANSEDRITTFTISIPQKTK